MHLCSLSAFYRPRQAGSSPLTACQPLLALSLVFILAMSGCSAGDLTEPKVPLSGSGEAGTVTLVLASATDSRLPAAGFEAESSTAEDRAMFGRLAVASPVLTQPQLVQASIGIA